MHPKQILTQFTTTFYHNLDIWQIMIELLFFLILYFFKIYFLLNTGGDDY